MAMAIAAMTTAAVAKTTQMTTNSSRQRCEQVPAGDDDVTPESRDFSELGAMKRGLSRCLCRPRTDITEKDE